MWAFARGWGLPWLGFALVLSLGASVSQPFVAETGLGFWTATADQVIERAGGSDAGTYLRFARILQTANVALVSHPTVQAVLMTAPHLLGDLGAVHNWPPGFPMLVVAVLAVTGDGAYFVKMLAIAVALWATALTLVLNLVPFHSRPWLRWVVLGSLWLLPDLREWTVGRGYVYSEATATAILVAALALLTHGLRHRRPRACYGAAALLGVAANCRAILDLTFEIVGTLFLTFVLGWMILAASRSVLRGAWRSTAAGLREALADEGRLLGVAAVCLVIFNLETAPWKLFNYVRVGTYSFSASGPALVWQALWIPPERLPFWLPGANTACVVDPVLCKDPGLRGQQRELALATLRAHPGRWAWQRVSHLNWLWAGRPWRPPGEPALWPWFYGGYVEGIVCFAAFLWGLWLLGASLRSRRLAPRRGPLLVLAGLVAAHSIAILAIFTIVAFEPRYFIGPKVFFLWSLATVLAIRAMTPEPGAGRLEG